jgi:Protein of unknown function (DUF3617)
VIFKPAAGALLLLVACALWPARAADTLRPGKWEYTVTTRTADLPQLPPGVKLPPNLHLHIGRGGMTVSHTGCLRTSDPAAALAKPHGPGAAHSQCTVERMQRSGGTITWATTCTMPDGVLHSEGTAHYTGERIEADFRTRTTRPDGPPMKATSHVVGRYLGPCDEK